MNAFKAYIRSRTFFIHLGLISLFVFILIFSTLRWLAHYTNHGDFVVVPDFKTHKLADLEAFVKDSY
ncbi:MAG: hypothetical protein EBU33_05805 [Sphingobacteriia bacterium]|nr:hypothetical protein [Sphingobacteriia bacterium]